MSCVVRWWDVLFVKGMHFSSKNARLLNFRYFLDTISIIQIEKSVDGVLGIRTRGRRMVGTDKTTELCNCHFLLSLSHSRSRRNK